jgi:hypothetical protein
MKRLLAPLLMLVSAAIPAGAEQMIPAGSVLQCTVADRISSKTTLVGDPVLCQVSHAELYGRSTFPFGSYLEGHFEAYKDPGHFVGKGWMELKFDRMVVGNDTVIPIETRVIATSGKNAVTADGRILGTGHAVRDTVEWLIPVLWPIDLINLPRRGPTPVLKPETRLTVKVLDDFGIPTKSEVQHQPELISRYNYADNQAAQQQAPEPVRQAYAPQVQQEVPAVPQPYYPPSGQSYTTPTATVVVVQPQAPVMYGYPPPYVYGYPPPMPYGYGYPPPPPPYAYAYPPVAYAGYYRPY